MLAISLLFLILCVAAQPKFFNDTTDTTTMDLVFYTPNTGLSRSAINYWQFVMCDNQPTQGWIQIIIDLPPNYIFNTTGHGWIAVEVGISATTFSTSTVLYTNYVWGPHPTACNTIMFPYDASTFVGRTVYVRATAELDAVSYGLQVKFLSSGSNACPGSGYNSQAFNTQVVNQNFKYFFQYGTTGDNALTVRSNDYKYVFFQFCASDQLSGFYSISIDLAYEPSMPRSSFNLYACAASTITLDDCTPYFNNAGDVFTAPFCHVSLSNSASLPLEDGIYILVVGLGGESSGLNGFILSAKLLSS